MEFDKNYILFHSLIGNTKLSLMVKKALGIFFLVLCGFSSQAQYEKSGIYLMGNFKKLIYTNELPVNLLTTRSVVVVSFPSEGIASAKIKNWKQFSAQIHDTFHEVGIDAVAYYNILDLVSGPETTKAFAGDFQARKFSNFIFLEAKEYEGTPAFNIFMTSINEDGVMLKENQQVYVTSGSDLERILKDLENKIIRESPERSNNLINIVPEYFSETKIIRGRRVESYAPDLRVDKLAVPLFPNLPLRQEVADSLKVKEEQMKSVLTEIFKSYPLRHEYVDIAKGDDAFRRSGCLYALYYINSSAGSVRNILNYNDKPEEEEVTVKVRAEDRIVEKRINLNKIVYKFYLKQLHSGDVFVGSLWDADEDWEAALNKFIVNLKKELKVE